jgi:TonB family protein
MRPLVASICLLSTALLAPGYGRSASLELQAVQGELSSLHQWSNLLRTDGKKAPVDPRGRREYDDFIQYAMPHELEVHIVELLERASKNREDAQASLDEARTLTQAAKRNSTSIHEYHSRVNKTGWRDRWRVFAAGNGLPTELSSPEFAAAEKDYSEQLASGDFEKVVSDGMPRMDWALKAAIQQATSDLVARDPAQLKFIDRSKPCVPGTANGRQKASITRAVSPSDYYPPGSIRRAEEGDIVLRAQVQPDNCASGAAIVVSSGYPDLDAAAFQIFEAMSFAAGVDEKGAPISSSLIFKVKFSLAD